MRFILDPTDEEAEQEDVPSEHELFGSNLSPLSAPGRQSLDDDLFPEADPDATPIVGDQGGSEAGEPPQVNESHSAMDDQGASREAGPPELSRNSMDAEGVSDEMRPDAVSESAGGHSASAPCNSAGAPLLPQEPSPASGADTDIGDVVLWLQCDRCHTWFGEVPVDLYAAHNIPGAPEFRCRQVNYVCRRRRFEVMLPRSSE